MVQLLLLESIISGKADREEDIKINLEQVIIATKRLHPVIWEQAIPKSLKRLLCKSTIEEIIVYVSQVRSMCKKKQGQINCS